MSDYTIPTKKCWTLLELKEATSVKFTVIELNNKLTGEAEEKITLGTLQITGALPKVTFDSDENYRITLTVEATGC